MDVLAFSLTVFWAHWLWPILLLVMGLGGVIFFHELGHFVVAKCVGIKVERFAMGFGPRLFSFKKGETDYSICLLPIGGFIKMLGQEDLAPLTEGEKNPRAYSSKTVGQRFAVISAGVIMNVIIAAILFIIIGIVSISFTAPIVGDVAPGLPAAGADITWDDGQIAVEKGLKPRDKIIEINGKKIRRFEIIQTRPLLSDPSKPHKIIFERQVDGKARIGTATLTARQYTAEHGGKRYMYGIVPPLDIVLLQTQDMRTEGPLLPGDRIFEISGQRIEDYWQLEEFEKNLTGEPINVTIARTVKVEGRKIPELTNIVIQPQISGGKSGDVIFLKKGRRIYGTLIEKTDDELKFRTEAGEEKTYSPFEAGIAVNGAELIDILGLTPRIRIAGVTNGAPADKAGIEPGDIIVGYADHGAPTYRRLHEITVKHAYKRTTIQVMRDGKILDPMPITPKKKKKGRILIGVVPGVDLGHMNVAGVRPGSPADKAGMQPGDVLIKVNDVEVSSWPAVLAALGQAGGKQVDLTYRRGDEDHKAAIGLLDKSVFDPADYTITAFTGASQMIRPFKLLQIRVHKTNPVSAIIWGVGETSDFIVMTYGTLGSLIQRWSSPKELLGPIGIGSTAIVVARQSVVRFLYLMAMISVSLAVVNFLPIPVVDGGHAVFLLIEKLRGKPLSVRVMNFAQVTGLVMLLMVFVAITWQDLMRLINN